MPSIKLFRRSTKAPTEASRSIGTKLKESKLAKKASALNQTIHAKQAQFKTSIDKNCHQIGNFVASKIKYNKSKKINFHSPLELNGQATPLFLAPLAPDATPSLDSPLESNANATPSLAALGTNNPEKVNLGEHLEKAIDRIVDSFLCSTFNGVFFGTNSMYQARERRRQKENQARERIRQKEILETWIAEQESLIWKERLEAYMAKQKEEYQCELFEEMIKLMGETDWMPKANNLRGTMRYAWYNMMEEGCQTYRGSYDLIPRQDIDNRGGVCCDAFFIYLTTKVQWVRGIYLFEDKI